MLQVLAGTESALSAAQILRLADKGSRAGQLYVLDRLVEHGLVTASTANRGYMYRLNRQHVLAPAILAAVDARREVVARITRAASALQPAPVHASLYGSFARGEAGPASDIDLLLVVRSERSLGDDWTAQVHALGDDALAWTGNRLEAFVISLATLRSYARQKAPIVASWQAHGQVLLGEPLSALLTTSAPDARRTTRR